MRIHAHGRAFDCSVRAYAWQVADGLDAVDGTLELDARGNVEPGVVAFVHGRLAREHPGGPFVVPFATGDVIEIVSAALEDVDLAEASTAGHIRDPEARWNMTECPLPETTASRYAGRAKQRLDAELALGSEPWMQDWPLEVSDPARLGEFCALYDASRDPDLRFDVMQLALYSLDALHDRGRWSPWFIRTLGRDFALHGHTVAQWAALDREPEDAELRDIDPQQVYAISAMLRDVWDGALVPVPSTWPNDVAPPRTR